MSKRTMILKFNCVKFYYGQHMALDIDDFQIEKGKITALIGPSGSGKSTLLRIMNLIYQLYPEQRATGQIYFKGKNILLDQSDPTQLRSKIGMVFQRPSPFPLSIFKNVAFAIKLHEKLSRSQLKTRVQQALTRAALWEEVKDVLHNPATQLSGGQQQRLCIARAIATQPELLLLDEPTSALDPQSAKHIESLINELKQDITIVFVTHNLAQARRIADMTAYLHHGKLIEVNQTEQLFTRPQNPLTCQYVSKKEDT